MSLYIELDQPSTIVVISRGVLLRGTPNRLSALVTEGWEHQKNHGYSFPTGNNNYAVEVFRWMPARYLVMVTFSLKMSFGPKPINC